MKHRAPLLLIMLAALSGIFATCRSANSAASAPEELPFLWENATVYFLLTDRFYNGDPSNDVNFGRTASTGMLRGFEGGDLAGVRQKLEEGYFSQLGVSALWCTPWMEQIHGATDEGTGNTYGFHGYWISDWTALDPNFGSGEELASLIQSAHQQGIRIIMDVIINHTGPVTPLDPVWPEEWVRTRPQCLYRDYESTVTCTLVENLPDIRTESDQEVELPPRLIQKWEMEGRLDQELAELDAFFARTGYPRAPRYYLIKWLTDFVKEFGIDGYRLDTAKHIEEGIWAELSKEARLAFRQWKEEHPTELLDDQEFYMVGEVYGYGISAGRSFDFGDRKVDYYANGIDHLINFEFKESARQSYEELFSTYSKILHSSLKGQGVLNYLSSHDDGGPFDPLREKPMEAANKLLLCPGACQIYYGDESCRPLRIDGAQGDANLRSLMNWEELEAGTGPAGIPIREVLEHYRKLGQFRKRHPAVGAGMHQMISGEPYLFTRTWGKNGLRDQVLIGLDLPSGKKVLHVGASFQEGTKLRDAYSGEETMVKNAQVTLNSIHELVLLEMI